ncbi:restriction endonuclease subunit S [Enterococcus faecalis]|uniref:restriction endonuclease subunit S n=1 Tax=Enterococcus faecalis TaxID=1351 RepID=UPI001013BE76|nr:restriction endonuclease subunit S [Enterococcus faecalis]EGO7785179.1 restriction endonuclease subunit S [Enterococcus faecalis]EGO7907645.1 restriction endonuclease subunit S [Enterococcus faecalis]EGO8793995.1 restriction endonuclease subunit S [Enterococcus faecalis]EGO9138724.1 restriction endonuclease subunit S [Enterococcus faecalis]EHZ5158708.1 restriction endonuclease subunit S [Enterococcus faecalis]
MSNNRQPEIRFPGFMEDWEERKLDELVEQIIREVPKPNKPYYRMSVRSHAKGTFRQFVDNPDKVAMDKLFIVKKDDLVVNITFAWEHAIAVVKEENDGLLVSHRFPTYRADGKSDIKFLNYVVSKEDFRRKLEFISPGGAGRNRVLNKKDFLKLKIFVPKIEEQQKIGMFFKQLDDTIALHQRKLDLLKETKKGFLQKMFPKNGAKVPEIRFPGFTEDWEERRLQEVVDRYDNLRIPITASKRVAGNTPYYGANGIQGYVEGYTHDGEFILVAEDGANDLKNYPVQYVDGKVWVNNHAHVIQAKENLADNMFLMNAIRSINIEPFLVGGGRAKLNADVLMKLEVIIPLKSEQQKIGAFFKQLDDTIALHQRKLDLLKETKKGFLQKMFV